jgi:hypothetical protein
MHLPNETTSQNAEVERGLPGQTGEENRRQTSASKSTPGRKSKRDKSIPQHEEDQARRGGEKRGQRGRGRRSREGGSGAGCTKLRTNSQEEAARPGAPSSHTRSSLLITESTMKFPNLRTPATSRRPSSIKENGRSVA